MFCCLALLVLFTVVSAGELTSAKVQKGIRFSVDFLVLPNEKGEVESCELKSFSVIKKRYKKKYKDFKPPQKFIDTACKINFTKGANWIPKADINGQVIPYTETCKWSKELPDSPICRTELQGIYAEDIPRGIGYSTVFKLNINTTGSVSECSFTSTAELTQEAKIIDVTPHQLFIDDACRKLSSIIWQSKNQEVYMFCRYLPRNPVRAFCPKSFGQ